MLTLSRRNSSFLRLLGRGALCAIGIVALGCQSADDEENASPIHATQADLAAGNASLKTAIVGVHVGRNREIAIAFASRKNTPFFAERGQGDLRIEAKDPRTAAVIGVGSAKIPDLCDCPATEAHYEGDVKREHEATVLVKVPYVSGDETLSLTAQDPESDTPVTLKAELAEVAR